MMYFPRLATTMIAEAIIIVSLAGCSIGQMTGDSAPSASSTLEENTPSQEVNEWQVADTSTPSQSNEITTCTLDDLSTAVNNLVGRSIYDHGLSRDTDPDSIYKIGPGALADMLPDSCVSAGSNWGPGSFGSGDIIIEISDGVSFYDVGVEFNVGTGDITDAGLGPYKRNMPEDQMPGASYGGFFSLCDPTTKT